MRPPTPEVGLVSKAAYLSPEIAAAERSKLWPRVWLHAAAADLVARPGQFVTVRLGGATEVLVIRGDDGEVRAFHNVCQHRGRRLVDDASGELRTLRCPLHHWQWDLDGGLARVPERASFGALAEGDVRLPALACASWNGQVFVHLGQPEQTLAEWLAPATDALAPYDLADYALVDLKTFELPCNWKTVADLFNEAYHVPAVHPYLLGSVDETTVVTTLHGPHAEQTFELGRPGPHVSPTEVTEALEELLKSNGADPAKLEGDARRGPALLREALRARGLTALSDAALTMGRSWFLFPSQTLNVYPMSAMLHRHRPHPTDPERTSFDQLTFTRIGAGEPRPTPRISTHARPSDEGDTGRVTEDDLAQVIAVQAGMRSPGFEGPRLGRHERAILHMHATLDAYLATPSLQRGIRSGR